MSISLRRWSVASGWIQILSRTQILDVQANIRSPGWSQTRISRRTRPRSDTNWSNMFKPSQNISSFLAHPILVWTFCLFFSCGIQSLRQIRLNEVLLDYSREAALIITWVVFLLLFNKWWKVLSLQVLWSFHLRMFQAHCYWVKISCLLCFLTAPCQWGGEECVPARST